MRVHRLILLAIVPAVLVLVAAAARTRLEPPRADLAGDISSLAGTVARVNQLFEHNWNAAGLVPAEPRASDLQVLRRLSLALHGTVPSLEEIRRFEADRGRSLVEVDSADA